MGIYDTKTLLQGIQTTKPVKTFLRDTFFPAGNDTTLLTKTAEFDVKKGKRRIAPFVAPRVGGVTISREGFETHTITTPLIAPQRVLTVDDLESRAFGENIVSTITPQQRQAKIIADDLLELDEMITRREEAMIADLLFNGKVFIKAYIDYDGKNTQDSVIDFGKKTNETAKKLWSAADADIITDLRNLRREIIKESGSNANVLILGSKVYDELLKNEAFLKFFDIKNLNLATINPVVQDNGAVTYVGRITSLGIDMYTYDEWYLDADGVEKPVVPEDKILLASRNLGKFMYGAVTQIEEGQKNFTTYVNKRVPKVWTNNNTDTRMMRLASRPVATPFDIEAWKVLKVL